MNKPTNMMWAHIRLVLLAGLTIFNQQVSCQLHEDDTSLTQALNSTSFLSSYSSEDGHDDHSRCQPLDIPFCDHLPYSKTILPNFMGQRSREEVIKEINLYTPIAIRNCSPDLRLFLCTLYAPVCIEDGYDSKPLRIFPCRSLCESAKQDCSETFNMLNYSWPEALICDRFPKKDERNRVYCVGRDGDSASTSNSESSSKPDLLSAVMTRDLSFSCPKSFEYPSYTLQLNGKSYSNCALPCDNVLLDKHSANLVRYYSGISALVCILSSLFTCVTFLLNTKRLKYPARPIMIISLCQLMVATCYLIGFLTDNKIACNDPLQPPKSLPNLKMIRTTTTGNKKGICTLQFMVIYFFQMSSMFWWLMMALSWYMIARLKWAPEAVSNISRYFHLLSWTAPALLTIYLSVLGDIEGDPLTGTCQLSSSNQESIRQFLIYPILATVLPGMFFSLSGFKSLYDSREALRHEFKETGEHKRLLLRIGAYSIFFFTSALALVLCLDHEQSNLNLWMLSWLSRVCDNPEYSIPCPAKNFSGFAPHYSAFLIKLTASMTMGAISALFMLSDKTFRSYKEMSEKCTVVAHLVVL